MLERWRGPWRRTWWWGLLSALLGLLAWYVAAGGTGSLAPDYDGAGLPPLDIVRGDLLLLSGTAAATATSLVVRDWWARLVVLALACGVFWGTRPLARDVAHEPLALLALLGLGQMVGFLVGTAGRRWPAGRALVLALLTALLPTPGLSSVALVLALALCGGLVRQRRAAIAGAAGLLVGVVLVAVASQSMAQGLFYAWSGVRRGSGTPHSVREAVARVLEPMRDLLRERGADIATAVAGTHVLAFALGVAAAVVLAGVRLSADPASSPDDPPAEEVAAPTAGVGGAS